MVLPRYSVFAAFLASAGVPIYIHAPKYFADTYGTSLASIGIVLFLLRLLDFGQDPLLGWIVGRIKSGRSMAALLGAVGMMLGMFGLFAVAPPIDPLVWMAATLIILFTSFSFLSILFYARGVAQAEMLGHGGHVRLGGWREAGSLLGITAFCILPVGFGQLGAEEPFTLFVFVFVGLGFVATLLMHRNWAAHLTIEAGGFADLLAHSHIRWLLLIGLLNAAPVAVTSTLFLFFVESRLGEPDLAGPFLVAFFAAAAISTPGWSRLAQKFRPDRVLAMAMVLAIASFVWAYGLRLGDTTPFLIICILSGAALGADMTLPPAMMSHTVAEVNGNSGQALGLWNFAAKASLALAAIAVLPSLDASGFRSGLDNDVVALQRLSFLYAVLPIGLKLAALLLLLFTFSKVRRTC